jgi:hypothetical protein
MSDEVKHPVHNILTLMENSWGPRTTDENFHCLYLSHDNEHNKSQQSEVARFLDYRPEDGRFRCRVPSIASPVSFFIFFYFIIIIIIFFFLVMVGVFGN